MAVVASLARIGLWRTMLSGLRTGEISALFTALLSARRAFTTVTWAICRANFIGTTSYGRRTLCTLVASTVSLAWIAVTILISCTGLIISGAAFWGLGAFRASPVAGFSGVADIAAARARFTLIAVTDLF